MYRRQGNIDLAIASHKQAIEASPTTDGKVNYQKDLLYLGKAYEEKWSLGMAVYCYLAAQRFSQQSQDWLHEKDSLMHLAEVARFHTTSIEPEDLDVAELQKLLRKLGLYEGHIDGYLGPMTQAALRDLCPKEIINGSRDG
ncbi:MAG: peptidoglycan-binding domain-containing protein [Desulfobacca sp.]|nr:peptidoglycan-binding domain-containing protein [Desulfobacca sp.]